MSDTDHSKSEIIVLQSIPSHHALMKSNRWLVRGILFLMAVIVVGGFLLLPSNGFLDQYKKNHAAERYQTQPNPMLSAEVDTLKGQLVGLVSGSIESKLRSLEDSLRSGSINHSLGTIEDIKNDVQVLRSYSTPEKPEEANPANTLANQQLIQEMSHLKRLIYLSFASCGLMLAALAGIWIKQLPKLPYKEVIARYLHRH